MANNLQMKFYSMNSPAQLLVETPPTIPENMISESLEAEARLSAAYKRACRAARCACRGLSCIVLDKNTGLKALAGQIAAVNSRVMAELGITIDKKQLAADWMKVSGSRVQEDLLWIFINRSAEGFEWMLDLTEGSVEAKVFIAYRGPVFGEYFGTHHIYRKEGCDKYSYKGGGMLACEIFEKALLGYGGKLYRGTAAEQLEKDKSGKVTSCIAKCADGRYRRYIGSKAVVLATGDCSDDRERSKLLPHPANKAVAEAGNTGDGQKRHTTARH